MNKAILGVAALSLVAAAPVYGQRRFRVGPTYSSITLEDLSGNAHRFSSFGGSVALITGNEGGTGVTVSRDNDPSTHGGLRRLTLFWLGSYYYPIWAHRVAPFAGVRFRRDTKKAGTVGLQIDFAPLKVTSNCSPPRCEPNAVLFAPGYEASARPQWGRLYGEVGVLLAGVYSAGGDRGIAQGLHGGIGCDFYSGRVMWNVNSRLPWLKRNSGEDVFGGQLGLSLSPKLRLH